jgi:uncharacterized protein with PIN domain
MSDKQFLAALERHGMRWTDFMGYVELRPVGNSKNGTRVSVLNTGTNNKRAWLAYLLKDLERVENSPDRCPQCGVALWPIKNEQDGTLMVPEHKIAKAVCPGSYHKPISAAQWERNEHAGKAVR